MDGIVHLPDIRNAENLTGRRVLVRTGFDVPIIDGMVGGTLRIKRAFDTVFFLKEKGVKVILISHMGGGASLRPVHTYLKDKMEITFVESFQKGAISEAVDRMKDGDVLLLENLRLHKGEEANDPIFSQYLSFLADAYVNEAFSASHRKHASIVGVPELLSHYAGISFQKEVVKLSKALTPKRPALLIIGGAKFETKGPLIRKHLGTYDHIFVGGALAHDFFKEKGLNIGKSLASEDTNVRDLLGNEKIILPPDVTVTRGKEILTIDVDEIQDNDVIVDQGPRTTKMLGDLVPTSSFVLWNGPLGNYERGFSRRTEELADIIASSNAETIIGGGDTIASIEKRGIEDKFSFVSTGGGAMIDFLSNGTLPGIEALTV